MALKPVFITGAGNGIGAATAVAFGAAGHDVIVTDVDLEAAESTVRLISAAGGCATAHLLDVADPEAWAYLAAQLDQQHRSPGVVVNNAFALVDGPAHEQSESDWNRQLSVTLSSVYRSVRTFHGSLKAARGSVVNVGSVHAIVAWPERPAYAAAKGGMVALTRQLSIDYAPEVRVNCVMPGSIMTKVWEDFDDAGLAAVGRQTSLGRLGRPDEVASTIMYLASEGASYITGASLVVDGGLTTSVLDVG